MIKRYPVVFLLVAIVAGIVFADICRIGASLYIGLVLVLFLITIGLHYNRKFKVSGIVLLCGLAILSAFNYSFQYLTYPPGHIVHYADDDNKYTVFGTIDDWPDIREHKTSIYLRVDSIGYDNKIREGRGRILLNIQMETTALQYGDRIYFQSELYSIKGGKGTTGFDYQRFLNLKGVYASTYLPHYFNIQIDRAGRNNFYRVIDRFREFIIGIFQSSLDERSSAMASGFLIGVTKDIPPEIYQLFRDTGTLHLLAVSGSNVALVILFFAFILRASPYSLKTRTIILLMLIIVFSFLAYNQPSVVRAAVMAGLVLLGKMFQRRVDLNNIIAATAVIILLFKPTELYDVGFQLSFATAWGLIYVVPKITERFDYSNWPPVIRYMVFVLVVSAVAQLVSLPMSVFYFQRFPVISFISNIVIVPLVSVIVIGEVVLIFAGTIMPLLGIFVGSLLNPLLNLSVYLLGLFGSDKINMILHFNFSGWFLLIYFLLFFIIINAIQSKLYRRLTVAVVLICSIVTVVVSIGTEEAQPDISVFTVPGGLALYDDRNDDIVCITQLKPKDYSISDRIIYPFLADKEIAKPRLITLSGGADNVEQLFCLSEQFDSSTLYFPKASINQVKDIYHINQYRLDSNQVVFFGNNNSKMELGDNRIILSENLLAYLLDSTALIFADHFDEQLSDFIVNHSRPEIILAISIPEKNLLDFLILHKTININPVYCSRIPSNIKEFLTSDQAREANIPEIINLSEIGRIDFILENRQIHIGR